MTDSTPESDPQEPQRVTQQETLHLLRSMHGGDPEALAELIKRHLPWIEDRVHRRLGDELRKFGETGDFVQEAMVNVLEYGPQFVVNDEEHFRRLLARIVENALRGKHRHMHQQRRDARRERVIGSGTILSLDPPREDQTRPSSAADREEQIAWVRLAVELMPSLDREVLTLKEMEGLTFREIGERLDAKEDAVRMRYNRALPKLAIKVAALRNGRLKGVLDEESTEDSA